jgi:group I intron endonuclease
MIGIYKITSPSGKIYIGQSKTLEKRKNNYSNLRDCKNQPRLYASLVKYGFSEHIFEVIEECVIESLNTRERHWQDFYEVLGLKGLNCVLTATDEKPRIHSQETRNSISIGRSAFFQTPEGKEYREKQSRDLKAFYQTQKGKEIKAKVDQKIRAKKTVANTDYAAFQQKRIVNTDWAARTANFDYVARNANTDWIEVAKKHWKPILQFSKEGVIIKEWNSSTEAGNSLGISPGTISNNLRGWSKSAGGFIWKYKEEELEN